MTFKLSELDHLQNKHIEKIVFRDYCNKLKIIPVNIESPDPPDFLYTYKHERFLLELTGYYDEDCQKEEAYRHRLVSSFTKYYKQNSDIKVIGNIHLKDKARVSKRERELFNRELMSIINKNLEYKRIWIKNPADSLEIGKRLSKKGETVVGSEIYKTVESIRLSSMSSICDFNTQSACFFDKEFIIDVVKNKIREKEVKCKKFNEPCDMKRILVIHANGTSGASNYVVTDELLSHSFKSDYFDNVYLFHLIDNDLNDLKMSI